MIGNYDVIFNCSKRHTSDFNEFVGNKRFQIIMEMNSKRFNEAIQKGKMNICHAIVGEIVGTITKMTEPRGRFLAYTEQGEMKKLDEMKAHRRIFQSMCLMHKKKLTPIEKARLGRAEKIASLKKKRINLQDARFKLNLPVPSTLNQNKRRKIMHEDEIFSLQPSHFVFDPQELSVISESDCDGSNGTLDFDDLLDPINFKSIDLGWSTCELQALNSLI